MLVERAKGGDADAFTQIVQNLQDMAVGYAVALVGDYWLAEEIAQEAFLRAFLDLETLREPRAFRSWFRRIILTRCNRTTRRKRLSVVPLEEASQVESGEPTADDLANSKRVQNSILEAVKTLPEAEVMAVTLRYGSDYSYREIADFLDVPVSTVKSRLFAARRRLRDRLSDELAEDLTEWRPSRSEDFQGKTEAAVKEATVADPDGNRIRLVEVSVPVEEKLE